LVEEAITTLHVQLRRAKFGHSWLLEVAVSAATPFASTTEMIIHPIILKLMPACRLGGTAGHDVAFYRSVIGLLRIRL